MTSPPMSDPETPRESNQPITEPTSVAARNAEIARSGARRAKLYFAELPEMYEQHVHIRSELLGFFRDFKDQTRDKGNGIHHYANLLEARMRVHVNDFLLELYSLLEAKENPDVRRVLLQFESMPTLTIGSEEEYQAIKDTHDEAYAVVRPPDGEIQEIVIYDSPFAQQSYANLEAVVVHELIHVLVDRATRKRFLSEGVIQLITQKLTGRIVRGYITLTPLAEAVFELERTALNTWFATGNDDALARALEQSLGRYHSPETTRQLVQYVINPKILIYEIMDSFPPIESFDDREEYKNAYESKAIPRFREVGSSAESVGRNPFHWQACGLPLSMWDRRQSMGEGRLWNCRACRRLWKARGKRGRPSAGRGALPAALPQPPWKTARLWRVAAGFPQFPSPDDDERLLGSRTTSGEALWTRPSQAGTERHSGASSCLSAALESASQKTVPVLRG